MNTKLLASTFLTACALLAAPAKAETATGCLTPTGTINSVAIGDEPKRPCGSQATEISLQISGENGSYNTAVVIDADGDPVGAVLDTYTPIVIRYSTVMLEVPTPEGEYGYVIFEVYPSEIASTNNSPQFEGLNCTGDPLVRAMKNQGAFEAFQGERDVAIDRTTGDMWVARDEPPVHRWSESVIGSDGICRNSRTSYEYTTGELSPINLYEEFPPPYTFEVR